MTDAEVEGSAAAGGGVSHVPLGVAVARARLEGLERVALVAPERRVGVDRLHEVLVGPAVAASA